MMKELKQSRMKKLEIIVQGEYQEFMIDLLDHADDVLVMIITAVPEDLAEPILEGLTPFFNKHMGVVFTSDITVTRLGKFQQPIPGQ
jgi:hypothetical protein